MDQAWAALSGEDAVAGGFFASQGRPRPMCERACRRPLSHCLCASLPPAPLRTRGVIVVLQHPREEREALATARLLPVCLRRCSILRGRRFAGGEGGRGRLLLRAALRAGRESEGDGKRAVPLLLLFPAPGAEDLHVLASDAAFQALLASQSDSASGCAATGPPSSQPEHASDQLAAFESPSGSAATRQLQSSAAEQEEDGKEQREEGEQQREEGEEQREARAEGELREGAAYVLLALDGSWRQAREMFSSNWEPLLRHFRPVRLPLLAPPEPGAGFFGEYGLRKQVQAGGMHTVWDGLLRGGVRGAFCLPHCLS